MTTRPDFGFPTRTPAIPDVRTGQPNDIMEAVKEWIEVREGARGDGLDRAITMRDMLNGGLATTDGLGGSGRGGLAPIPLATAPPDPAIPPTPELLEAAGALKYILLTWQFARGYSRLAYFEVWRSLTDVIGEAVLVGQSFAAVYADDVGPGKAYYYWVRAVSDAGASGTSPFNALAGTLGQTALDPAYLLELLTGQITASQLHADLGARVDLIDGAGDLPGSVNQRVQQALAASAADLAAATAALQTGITANGSAIVSLQTTDSAHASDITLLGTRTGGAESSIVTLNATTASHATSLEALATRTGDAEASIVSLNATTASQATAVDTLSTTVGANTTSIQTHTSSIDGLSGQHTVKIDSNGYVSGYGLASTPIDGVPASAFAVRADSFYIASPAGPGVAPAMPFIVRTTITTINGVEVPVGVYIGAAFIANGSIGNAKIGNLQVDDAKIANLTVAKLLAGKLGVGEYIESTNYAAGDTGFRIHGNGNAEFSNATVRGTVVATAGAIGGNTIDVNGVQSPNFNGTTAGWRIGSDGVMHLNDARVRGSITAGDGKFTVALDGTMTVKSSLAGGDRTETKSNGTYIYVAGGLRVTVGKIGGALE